MNSKTFGSMMMVAGSVIGGGMLAMPINSAEVGFGVTFAELVVFYLFLIIPALACVEMIQFSPKGTTISGVAKKHYGRVGFAVSNALVYMFVYAVISAYSAGISGTLGGLLGVPPEFQKIFTVATVAFFGLMVIFTTRLADFVNRVFFFGLFVGFAVLSVSSLNAFNLHNLFAVPKGAQVVLKSIPLFFLAYGFHIIIPALYDYVEGDAKGLRTAIVGGLSIPLVIFTIWNLAVHGLFPQEKLIEFAKSGQVNIATLVNADSTVLKAAVTLFTLSALITSFIGASLALATTLREEFPKESSQSVLEAGALRVETRLSRPQLFVLIYALPVVLVLYAPQAFVFFLQIAAITSTLQAIILPMVLCVKERKANAEQYQQATTYRCFANDTVLIACSVLSAAAALLATF